MTNEDAIRWLDNLKNDIGNPHYEGLWPYAQAIDEIISMLEEHGNCENCAIAKLENQVESSVKQEDCADIMNKINDALEGTGYQATAFDNTGIWLCVIIEG